MDHQATPLNANETHLFNKNILQEHMEETVVKKFSTLTQNRDKNDDQIVFRKDNNNT